MSRRSGSKPLDKSMDSLKISTSNASSADKPTKKAPVADSWEEEAVEEEEDDDDDDDNETSDRDMTPTTPSQLQPSKSKDYPKAPPSTPAVLSPSAPSAEWNRSTQHLRGMSGAFEASAGRGWDYPYQTGEPSSLGERTRGDAENKRPEKTNAVASRLIAAGLGVKAPKRTEEQKHYDKSIRDQQRRQKEKEIADKKKSEEEAARAKKAIWGD